MQQTTCPLARWLKIFLGLSALGIAVLICWPDLAAVDRRWGIVGHEPVRLFEAGVLSLYPQHMAYPVELRKPAAPGMTLPLKTTMPTLATPTAPPTHAAATPTSPSPSWPPSTLAPFGTLRGEGQWTPYLQGAGGQTVAYRSFLQTDPQHPDVIAALVAFDLQATRLHFVLGTVEPIPASPQPTRTGAIPPADLQPGVLLATFNGGFRARPQHFGAMADGLIALPPIDGLATVAIYADGRVDIGEWGTDIQSTPDMVAWRQNCQMLIQHGEINPATAHTTEAWGLALKGGTIIWRSALGLSADGRTLYYVAGSRLDVATLTKVLAQTGAAEALQLDVNGFWVHFAAIRRSGDGLMAEPLLPLMRQYVDRYLKHSSRDFFYVTLVTPVSAGPLIGAGITLAK